MTKPETLARLKLTDGAEDIFIIRWRKGQYGDVYAQILLGTRDQATARKNEIVDSNELWGCKDMIYMRKVRGEA